MSIFRAFLCAVILVLFTTSLAAQERRLVLSGASPLGGWVSGDLALDPGVYVGMARDSVDWGSLFLERSGSADPGDLVNVSVFCYGGSVSLLIGGMVAIPAGQTRSWPAQELPLAFSIQGDYPSSEPCDVVIRAHWVDQWGAWRAYPVYLYVTVVEVAKVEWEGVNPGDGETNLSPDNPESHGGGWRLFPDANDFGGPPHLEVDCRVTVSFVVPTPNRIPVHLKALDVDDSTQDWNWINYDGNPADPEDRPGLYYGNDNRKGAWEEWLGITPEIEDIMIGYGAQTAVCRFYIPHYSMHPGNNFKIFATTDRKWRVDAEVNFLVQNGIDGVNSFRDIQSPTTYPPGAWSSPLLSIWRRLHVEKDSMGPPPPGFDGWDDEDDLLRDVDLPDPDTSALAGAFYVAYIEVVEDTGNDDSDTPWHYNFHSEGAAAEASYLRNNRQTEGNAWYWVCYVASTYEGHLPEADNDPNDEMACLAWSYEDYPNVAAVYEEIIRDVAAQWGWPEGLKELVRKLAPLHEFGHHFGLDNSDELYNCMWAHHNDGEEAIFPEIATFWFTLRHIDTIRHHWNLPYTYP